MICSLVTDWCRASKTIPDTQFGFHPCRNTLHLFLFYGTPSMLHARTLKQSGPGHMHTQAKWIGSGHMHTQAKWIWPHAHSSQVDLATCTLKPSGSCHMHTQANWILQVDLATCTLRSLMISSKHMAPSLDRTSVNTCRAHASQLYSVHYSRHDDADEFILKNGAMTARAAPKHV